MPKQRTDIGHFIPNSLQISCKCLSFHSQRPSHLPIVNFVPANRPNCFTTLRAEHNSSLLLKNNMDVNVTGE